MSHAVVHSPFETVLHKAHAWIAEVARDLGTEDRHAAYRALRAVLQALRDRLTVEEACDLAAQLPLLVRGVYFEGYKPSGKPLPQRSQEAFLEAVERIHGPGQLDPRAATCAVFALLARHVSAGEIADVQRVLPEALRRLWPQHGGAVLVVEAEPPPPAPLPAPGPDLSAAHAAVGATVKDVVGEKLGVVHDLVLDATSGQARFAILAFGGFLGLGEHLFPVPWRLLHWREGDGSFLLQFEGSRGVSDLPQAPKLQRSQWRPQVGLDRGLESAVHSFYAGSAM